MANFTEKQQAFIDAKRAGLGNEQAAIQAGFSTASAASQATRLMKRPEIRAAIKKGAKAAPAKLDTKGDDAPRMKPKYESSLELMRDTYNNPKMPDSIRFEAAKQALPYEHARVGEKGVKEKRKENAEGVAGNTRFRPKAPPKLHAVK